MPDSGRYAFQTWRAVCLTSLVGPLASTDTLIAIVYLKMRLKDDTLSHEQTACQGQVVIFSPPRMTATSCILIRSVLGVHGTLVAVGGTYGGASSEGGRVQRESGPPR